MIGRLEATVLDPRTKRSVAFYAALAVTCYSVIKHGLNWSSGGALLTMAGIATWDAATGKRQDGDGQ